MVNRNQKGKRVEREIAKLLTKATGDDWNRVLNSGGYATATGTEEGRFRGDVFSDDWPSYCIEVKSTKDNISLSHFFSKKSKVNKYIKQAVDESGDATPVLFVKINHRGTYIFFNEEDEPHAEEILRDMDTEDDFLVFWCEEYDKPWTVIKVK